MPGFIAHIGKSSLRFAEEKRKKLVVNNHTTREFQIERRVINKFMNDRIFQDTDEYFVLVEGVVLNNHELIEQYQTASWVDCVIKMYQTCGDAFFKDFRGSFSGLFFDKKQDKWLIYTNHIGDKQVFLYKIADNDYIFASEIGFIVDTLKTNGITVSLDKTGAYFALTHGFVIEDNTLVQGVRKLVAGTYYKLEKGDITEITYHRFSNKAKEMSPQEAIDGIEKYFSQAIKRAFEKDREYGYQHLACLSGGLDSRMTVMVAHEMGYIDQLNITYSQSGYLDFSIAQDIAIDLHHDWLFKPLDGGDCIRDIDTITNITLGSANFFGLAHGNSLERLINYDNFGIAHTGQLGDVIIGTYLKQMDNKQPISIQDGAYSLIMIDRLQNYKLKYDYADAEIFMMYNRGFGGIGQGLLTFQELTESYSPFTDVDFFEFCFSIPLELRYNHKIYFDWIFAKHPKAADYIWEKIKKKIEPIENVKPKMMKLFGKQVPAITDKNFSKWLYGSMMRRLGLRKKGNAKKTMVVSTKEHMNPVDYWYQTNPFIKSFMQTYWEENQHYITDDQLKNDMQHLFMDCVLMDKLQALSVLSTIKLLKS